MSQENEDAEFEAFAAAEAVEVGEAAPEIEKEVPEPAPEPKEGDTGETSEDDDEKPNRSPKESQIDRLKRERAAAQRESRDLKRRLENLENSGGLGERLANVEKLLQAAGSNANSDNGDAAPDPSDTDKIGRAHV